MLLRCALLYLTITITVIRRVQRTVLLETVTLHPRCVPLLPIKLIECASSYCLKQYSSPSLFVCRLWICWPQRSLPTQQPELGPASAGGPPSVSYSSMQKVWKATGTFDLRLLLYNFAFFDLVLMKHSQYESVSCKLTSYVFSGLQDYQAALKLDPHNAALQADTQTIRDILQGSATGTHWSTQNATLFIFLLPNGFINDTKEPKAAAYQSKWRTCVELLVITDYW